MKYTHFLVLVFSVLFLSACSSSTGSVAGEGSVDSSGEAVAASEARDDGYRCERVAVTGTRMKTKYCTTAKQRKDIAAASASAVSGISRTATQAGGPSGK